MAFFFSELCKMKASVWARIRALFCDPSSGHKKYLEIADTL